MAHFETTLLRIADIYSAQVRENGGKSLARIATLLVNRGSFFEPLRRGQTCSVRNFEKVLQYFQCARNWPTGTIPDEAICALKQIGDSAQRSQHLDRSAA
jgi:hypothetical protein